MGAVLEFAVRLVTITCGTCGIEFAVPENWKEKRVAGENGNRDFWCPNGHARRFTGETEEQRLRRELDRKDLALKLQRERAENLESRLKGQRAATTRVQNKLKRTKERVGHGVCPCCNRTFEKLARHMTTKHPDYAKGHEPGDLAAIDGGTQS